MPSSRILAFTDPQPYSAAIRAATVEVFPAAKGDFRAELTQIELHRLWMQRGRESLQRVFHSAVSESRAPIVFLADADQPAMHHTGMEVSPGEIILLGRGVAHHHRTWAPCRWASMSLTPEDLAAAANAVAGRDLTVPSTTHVVRPAPALTTCLIALHGQAAQIAKSTPDKLMHPEVARSLEQALIHTMIRCLTDGSPMKDLIATRRHAAVIGRLEELLAANHDRPLYLAEICAATGVSERTLRACCHEHLGMGPVRYLWLRRMHLARAALRRADPATATVTVIAADHGFWELGRFSVEYRALFGESPSTTLRRPPDDRQAYQNRPSDLPTSEFA